MRDHAKDSGVLYGLRAGFVALAVLSSLAGAAEIARPNILWVVTEDIGCDMACYGTKGVHTPNMDQLAAEGVTERYPDLAHPFVVEVDSTNPGAVAGVKAAEQTSTGQA